MILELQKFLRDGGTFEELEQLYSIVAKRHREYPELFGFYYNQISSPFHEKIVQECRGVILNSENNWNAVSCPFFKFFNHGDPLAANIDMDSAYLVEKLDGSLITLFRYNNKWNVATNGTPDALGEVNDSGITFKDLVIKIVTSMTDVRSSMAHDCCFMFELTSPYNRIVVQHTESKLTLIGIRYLRTLEEVPVNKEMSMNFLDKDLPRAKVFPLISPLVVEHDLANMKGTEQEGFIVVDKYFNRVKMKCPDYLRLHRLVDNGNGLSFKRILDIVRTGETPEVLLYFPEYTTVCNEVKEKYEAFISNVEQEWDKYRHIENRKEFAITIKDNKYRSLLFQYKTGMTSIRNFLAEIPLSKAVELIE